MPKTTKPKSQHTPADTETSVFLLSRRRCCICFGLNNNTSVKPGQIAHLDGNRSNSALDNLVFLCLEHHDAYDSSSSQSKGLTIREVKKYRAQLYEAIKAQLDRAEHDELRERDLRTLEKLFIGIFTPALDAFFLYGREGIFDFDIFFYYEAFSAYVLSINFYVYDDKLWRRIKAFQRAWAKSLNYGNYFMPDQRGKLRFTPPPDNTTKVVRTASKKIFLNYRRDLGTAERNFRALLKYVKENYKELDTEETNQAALALYQSE